MKIIIQTDEHIQDTEIVVTCNKLTAEVEKMLATLRMLDQQLMVTKEDESYLLDVEKVAYIEAMERKTFVYTEEDVYESKLKLYIYK